MELGRWHGARRLGGLSTGSRSRGSWPWPLLGRRRVVRSSTQKGGSRLESSFVFPAPGSAFSRDSELEEAKDVTVELAAPASGRRTTHAPGCRLATPECIAARNPQSATRLVCILDQAVLGAIREPGTTDEKPGSAWPRRGQLGASGKVGMRAVHRRGRVGGLLCRILG